MKNLYYLLAFVFTFIACDKQIIDENYSNQQEDLILKSGKLDICHWDEEKGTWVAISVPEVAWQKAHEAHGDMKIEDWDGDGYYAPNNCGIMGEHDVFDCDDNNPNVHPDEVEICGDGIDNNCNGDIDEGCNNLPDLICEGDETYCGELILFEPSDGDGYIDIPIGEETSENQYASWARRDVVMAIKYAAAKVLLISSSWNENDGNGGDIGLGYFSEEDGSTPENSNGLMFPPGTHVNGLTGQIAYYQLNPPNNYLRPVCEDNNEYHCTQTPDNLDTKRTALFIACLSEHPNLVVVGVDGEIGPIIESALFDLTDDEIITEDIRDNAINLLAYEENNEGLGWYLFHHFAMTVRFVAN